MSYIGAIEEVTLLNWQLHNPVLNLYKNVTQKRICWSLINVSDIRIRFVLKQTTAHLQNAMSTRHYKSGLS